MTAGPPEPYWKVAVPVNVQVPAVNEDTEHDPMFAAAIAAVPIWAEPIVALAIFV